MVIKCNHQKHGLHTLIKIRLNGKTLNLTETLDRWVESMTWSPDSTRIFFTSEDRGRTGLQMIQATGGGTRNIITGSSTLSDVQFTADGRTMIYMEQSGSKPAELFKATSTGGTGVPLTHLNDALLGRSTLTPLEEVFVDAPDKSKVHAFIVKPPDFSASTGAGYRLIADLADPQAGLWAVDAGSESGHPRCAGGG